MKERLFKFIIVIVTIFMATIIFGAWFYYCYALSNINESPFKETLSLSLTFLGSFGTLASIVFAFYLYIKQREKDQDDVKSAILKNKPQLFIKIEDIYRSKDNNGQPALAIDLKVINYNNDASSFSLGYEYLENDKKNIIVDFDYPFNSTNIFKSGENLNITATFISSTDIIEPPNLEELNFYIKAIYLDKINNMIEDYYRLTPSKNNSISISKIIKSNIITVSGKYIEIK